MTIGFLSSYDERSCMRESTGNLQPRCTSLHVEFVARGSRRPCRAVDTHANPGQALEAVFATIVADTFGAFTGESKLPFRSYEIFINRPRDTPFFPIAANEKQMESFNRSLVNPPHARIPDALLPATIEAVIEKYGTSCFTVYEAKTLP